MKRKESGCIQPVFHGGLLAAFCLFLSLHAAAQTPISGYINDYYSVIEVIPSKGCVRLNATNNLGYGDRTMIIQMKGASINSSNNSSYGDTTALNGAGNYELGTVCRVSGDSVFFIFEILNSYDVTSKVQLVRIPRYSSAIVTDTLKAAPWDPVTGRGGVLAMMVDDELTLNAPVSADSAGYRGGRYFTSSGTCSNFAGATSYYYNPANTTQNGAYKGEGVVEIPATQNGGRGAPANGGGGGNNHNNAGAGGANLTAGGFGGGNSSSSGCTLALAGRGGKALSNHGGTKFFLGGGGGAGHSNYALSASHGGGSGGGIIFIKANTLSGTKKISANGKFGGGSISDGAAGGGAGGTILLDILNYSGTNAIEANGGAGGTSNNGGNLNYCYGAGGGGSGGVIYFSGSTPALSVSIAAGAAGVEIGRHSSCAPIVPSGPGSAGLIFEDYTYRRSEVLNDGACGVALPIKIAYFRAHYLNARTEMSWRVLTPEVITSFTVERKTDREDWKVLDVIANAGNDFLNYNYSDESPVNGYNFYRLRIEENTGRVSHSAIQKILVGRENQPVKIFPNPARERITVTGDMDSDWLILYDINGRETWRKKLSHSGAAEDISLPPLSPGMYILKIGSFTGSIAIL